jgi:aspartyl-tRNA(Asn)/glutamyl-tRNA(Gln) amidotransferase subunit B
MTPSTPPLVRGYEVVIGFETHAQLSTRSKIFSGASTAFGAAPNTQACAVDLALPGTLPVLNRGAVERAIRFGLAIGAEVAPLSIFARKNYFYPDLPKGYQISQYEIPVVQGGQIEFMLGEQRRTLRLTRAHLEEDAGKSLHEDYHGQTGIDLNRAGTPLLEIVSEPELRSSAEAVAYARALHTLVVWLGICDGNMQEGSFRCDANVSVRRPGARWAPAARSRTSTASASCSRRSTTRCSGRSTASRTGCRSSRPPCCSTRTPARPGRCAARRTRTTTATSPTRTCRRW